MINTEYAPNEVRKIRIKKLRRNQEKYEDGRNEDNKRIKKDKMLDEEEDEEKEEEDEQTRNDLES